jgi:hypothetical protein
MIYKRIDEMYHSVRTMGNFANGNCEATNSKSVNSIHNQIANVCLECTKRTCKTGSCNTFLKAEREIRDSQINESKV